MAGRRGDTGEEGRGFVQRLCYRGLLVGARRRLLLLACSLGEGRQLEQSIAIDASKPCACVCDSGVGVDRKTTGRAP